MYHPALVRRHDLAAEVSKRFDCVTGHVTCAGLCIMAKFPAIDLVENQAEHSDLFTHQPKQALVHLVHVRLAPGNDHHENVQKVTYAMGVSYNPQRGQINQDDIVLIP